MATIEEAWKALLVAGANLNVIIGSRVYADALPEGVTVPAATFLIVSDIPVTAHDGDSGLSTAIVQTDFWSTSRLECASMRAAARADLNGYDGTASGLRITAVLTGSSPDYNPDLTLKRAITEWRVQYRTAV